MEYKRVEYSATRKTPIGESAFYPTPLKLFLDYRRYVENTFFPIQPKMEERPFPAKMVLYITGDIAIKGHKKKLLSCVHRCFSIQSRV